MILGIGVDELLSLSERINSEPIGQCTLDASVQPNREYLKLLLVEFLTQKGSILDVLFPEQFAQVLMLSEADCGDLSPFGFVVLAVVEVVEVVSCARGQDCHHLVELSCDLGG